MSALYLPGGKALINAGEFVTTADDCCCPGVCGECAVDQTSSPVVSIGPAEDCDAACSNMSGTYTFSETRSVCSAEFQFVWLTVGLQGLLVNCNTVTGVVTAGLTDVTTGIGLFFGGSTTICGTSGGWGLVTTLTCTPFTGQLSGSFSLIGLNGTNADCRGCVASVTI